MNTKIYIAGKITGEDYQKCFDKFQAIDDTLTDVGYQVINPLKIVPKGTEWEEAMTLCKPHIINTDIVFFLNDWKHSEGAQLERHWAKLYKVRIVDYENLAVDLMEPITNAI